MIFMRPLFLGPVFFLTALLCSGGYYLERGGLQLHDAVGINCKNGATIDKNKVKVSVIWAKGSMLIIECVI